MRKNNHLKIILFMLSLAVLSGANDSEPWKVPYAVEGKWRIVDDSSGLPIAVVRLWIKRDTLNGSIEEIYDKNLTEDPVCTQCIDSLKNKPFKGMRFLWGFVEKRDHWIKGRLLDLQDRKVYKGEIDLSDDRENLLVFSYVNFIVKIGRTQKWVKEK